MADYKDIIAGTIGNIVGKVKEAAESGTVRDFYEQGATRAKSIGRIAKLTLEMNGDAEELKRVYTEIGKLCYDQMKDAPEGFYAPLFSQVEEIMARVDAKSQEIEAMKAEFDVDNTSDIDVEFTEFDDVISSDENENKGE